MKRRKKPPAKALRMTIETHARTWRARLDQLAERRAAVLAWLMFVLIFWADQDFPWPISFAPFYCAPVALLAWYRNAQWAWAAALLACVAEFLDVPDAEVLQTEAVVLGFRLFTNLLLYGSFCFLTLKARTHLNRLRDSKASLERLAFHDRLTGLPNRALLYDRLAVAISLAMRHRRKVALLFLDLDGFKAINDQHGHQAGDAVLKVVASRLEAVVRSSDTVARLGGDEFALVLGDLENPAHVSQVAEKVLQVLSDPIQLDMPQRLQVGASIGISVFPEHGSEIDRLLACADTAMYQSKAAGRQRYTLYREPDHRGNESNWMVFSQAHEVGVPEIDQQHRQLVLLANFLNDAIRGMEPPDIIARRFDELILYTQFHFATEERLMERYGYPMEAAHRTVHTRLVEEVGAIKQRLEHGGELIALQTIKDWLLDHIEHMDKPMGRFLAEHHVESSRSVGALSALRRHEGAEWRALR